MFKQITIAIITLFVASCSTGTKVSEEKYNFVTFDLRSYDIVEASNGWIACRSDYIEGNPSKNLSKMHNDMLTVEDKENCASYRCLESHCSTKGSYPAFSEVVNFLLKKNKRVEYTSKKKKNNYNIDEESDNCFKAGEVNSCAILSAYYRYGSYDRSSFYKVRTRECELLGISQKSCSFDL